MGFTTDRREQIKFYMLEKIEDGQRDIAKRTAEAFGTSLNTVYRYMRELERDGIIRKENRRYELAGRQQVTMLTKKDYRSLEEDIVYRDVVRKYVENLADNVQRIWEYAFMEMMNNVIDHSEAERVCIIVRQNYMNTTVLLGDDGVGIFRKIKDYYHYDSLDDAVHELFKGKLTTDMKNHSGEGIFFTSRALDRFAAMSDGKIFSHDKYDEILQNIKDTGVPISGEQKGTYIYMELSNFSRRNIKEVFDMFADVDGGFTRTRIPIKNIFETFPVSRSQAKRLCHRFEKFQEVELDFDGIDQIGQGFAHELFVVFQNEHPDVRLVPVNASADVEKMIYHVKGPAG